MAEDKKNRRDPLNDELNRRPFAKSIAALIGDIAKGKAALIQDNNKDNDKNKGGITIGIEGEWGEGKTHTIKLIKEEIETYNENKEKPIEWMVFNPWHFTDRQHLASLFLRDLAVFIEKNTKSKLRLWVEKNFLWVGRLLGYIFYFFYGIIKPVYPDIATVLLDYAELFEKLKDNRPTKTLETLKDDIKKKLNSNLPFSHIVVAVEDMDRLNPEEIRAMLQLMKMIADFPRITYLLAYDRTHVVNALGDLAGHRANRKEAREYGEGYLTKVVQAAYKLPAPPEDAVADLTLAEFKQRAKEFHGKDFDQQQYFQDIWDNFKKLMPTLRVGERIVNRAASMLLMLEDKCNPADVLVAAYLMQFQDDLWKWLGENYEVILPDFNRFIRHEPPRNRPKEGYVDEQIKGDDKLKTNIVVLLRLCALQNNIVFPEGSDPTFNIGLPRWFPIYVQYEHTSAVQAADIANALWQAGNNKERKESIEELKLYPDNLSLVLEDLQKKNNNNPMNWEERALPLLTYLGIAFDKLKDAKFVHDCAVSFINTQPETKRFQVFSDLLGRWLDGGAQFLPMYLLDILGIQNGYVDYKGFKSRLPLSLTVTQEQFNELKDTLDNKITHVWLSNEAWKKWLEHKHAANMLFMWLRLNQEKAKAKLNGCLQEDWHIFELLNALRSRTITATGERLKFADSTMQALEEHLGWDVATIQRRVKEALKALPHMLQDYPDLIADIRTLSNDSTDA